MNRQNFEDHAFEDHVRGMKFSDIVMAMVNALEAPKFGVFMHYWVTNLNGVIYGCAATHTIAHISGCMPASGEKMTSFSKPPRWASLGASQDFINYFELALDELRCGSLSSYNSWADEIKIKLAPGPYSLPVLRQDSWKSSLPAYRKHALTLSREGF